MQGHNTSEVTRRSSRVPIAVPLLVTSLDPSNDFSEVCETLVVSAHGCAIRSPMKMKAGIPVHFHTKDGRQMMARIVDCQPIGSVPQAWRLGAQLDQPDNFWGLNPCPEDWAQLHQPRSAPQPGRNGKGISASSSGQSAASQMVPDSVDQQLSADRLERMIKPLQAEVAALKEKLAQRESNRSRFEVSLSHIPPELEQELWGRLRQDLGQRVLQLTREEAERTLGAAHAAIDRRITQAQEELQQHASGELNSVEQRVQAMSKGIAETLQHRIHAAMEQFQSGVQQAEAHLGQQGEELFRTLHQQLEEERHRQRQDLQQLRDSLVEEWTRIETQLAGVTGQLTKLDESAGRLETDFDAHVTAVASAAASETKSELEAAADELLQQLRTRNAQDLGRQLEKACEQLKDMQSAVESSISQSLQARISHTQRSLEQTMNELSQQCVGRWRVALARQLDSFASLLGQELCVDGTHDNSGSK